MRAKSEELVAELVEETHGLLRLGRGGPFDELPGFVRLLRVAGDAEAVAAERDDLILARLLRQRHDAHLVGNDRILAGHVAVLLAKIGIGRPPVEHADIALGEAHAGVEPVVVDRFRRGELVEIDECLERAEVFGAVDRRLEIPGRRRRESLEPARALAGLQLRIHVDDRRRLLAGKHGADDLLTVEIGAVHLLDDLGIFIPGPAAVLGDLDALGVHEILAIEDHLRIGRHGQRADLAAPRIHRIEDLRDEVPDIGVLVGLDEVVERLDPLAVEILAEPHLVDRDDVGIGLVRDEGRGQARLQRLERDRLDLQRDPCLLA